MANPSGNGTNNNDVDHPSHHVGNSVPEPLLQHNPGASTDWTPDEQSILEDGLAQYASESNIIRYAKIAVQLQNKTVRDVALRCRWMFKRDINKRRKEEYILTRKSKDRKEKINDHLASTSHLATQTGLSSYVQGVVANGKSNALYNVLVSPAGQLLKESAQALERVSANLEIQQVHENISLLCQVRKNILDIMNKTSCIKKNLTKDILLNNLVVEPSHTSLPTSDSLFETPEKLKQMPPLPVKLNEDLFNSLLPRTTLQQMQ